MDLSKLTDKAKGLFQKRGGADAAKADAAELKDVAGRDEGLGDKAKDAGTALKDPGAPGDDTPASPV